MSRSIGSGWEIAKVISQIIGALLIPLVIAIVGLIVNSSLKDKEVNQQMVNLAIEILKIEPSQTVQQNALREWAVDVIDELSTIPLTEDAKRILLNEPLLIGNLPPSIGGLRYDIDILANSAVAELIVMNRRTGETMFNGSLSANESIIFSGSYHRITWSIDLAQDLDCSNLSISFEVFGRYSDTPYFRIGGGTVSPAEINLDNDRCEINVPDVPDIVTPD